MDFKLIEWGIVFAAALILSVWRAAEWWFKRNGDNGCAKCIKGLDHLATIAKEIQHNASSQHEQIISLQRECGGHFGILQQEASSLMSTVASYAQKLDIHRKEEETLVVENNRILTKTDQDGLPLVYRDAKHEKTVVDLLTDIKGLMNRLVTLAARDRIINGGA